MYKSNNMATLEIKKHPEYSDYGADIDGNIYSFKFNKVKQIALGNHGRGYLQFRISKSRQQGKMYLAHRFVYECWTGKLIGKGWQCHHIDHNKHNNSFDNIELVDQFMNMHYGKLAGVLYGSANPNHPFYNR